MEEKQSLEHEMLNHRRYNPLIDEWVIVAANRIKRPWQGAKETTSAGTTTTANSKDQERAVDEVEVRSEGKNALAPGGHRANGTITPEYTDTYIFTNDFPSLTDDGEESEKRNDFDENSLFRKQTIRGTCR